MGAIPSVHPAPQPRALPLTEPKVLARLKRGPSVNNCLHDVPGCGQFPGAHCPWPRGHALGWFFSDRRDAVVD